MNSVWSDLEVDKDRRLPPLFIKNKNIIKVRNPLNQK